MTPDLNKRSILEPSGHFRPNDFQILFTHIPDDCPLVGGQAVAWWAERYGVELSFDGHQTPVTSRDIDFWGGREDLNQLASRLKLKAVYPNSYEMTVWVGAIPFSIQGCKTLIEFIHTVPGLDTNNLSKACVQQEVSCVDGISRHIQILTPISLLLSKLHALRHFVQKDRQDEFHLRICLKCAKNFIMEMVEGDHIRPALWNIKRITNCHSFKSTQKLESLHKFSILDAIPVDRLREFSENSDWPEESRAMVNRFCQSLNLEASDCGGCP